jgi:hypothetical protein
MYEDTETVRTVERYGLSPARQAAATLNPRAVKQPIEILYRTGKILDVPPTTHEA